MTNKSKRKTRLAVLTDRSPILCFLSLSLDWFIAVIHASFAVSFSARSNSCDLITGFQRQVVTICFHNRSGGENTRLVNKNLARTRARRSTTTSHCPLKRGCGSVHCVSRFTQVIVKLSFYHTAPYTHTHIHTLSCSICKLIGFKDTLSLGAQFWLLRGETGHMRTRVR